MASQEGEGKQKALEADVRQLNSDRLELRAQRAGQKRAPIHFFKSGIRHWKLRFRARVEMPMENGRPDEVRARWYLHLTAGLKAKIVESITFAMRGSGADTSSLGDGGEVFSVVPPKRSDVLDGGSNRFSLEESARRGRPEVSGTCTVKVVVVVDLVEEMRYSLDFELLKFVADS
jgi:hypothetical protein